MPGKRKTRPKARKYDREKCSEIILSQIAGTDKGLRSICSAKGLPPADCFIHWVSGDDELAQRYARARRRQAELLAEQLLEIADDGTNDYVERQNKDGSTSTVLDSEHVQRSRLRVDTRKWILSKVLPKVYGDGPKVVVDASTKTIEIHQQPPEDLKKWLSDVAYLLDEGETDD